MLCKSSFSQTEQSNLISLYYFTICLANRHIIHTCSKMLAAICSDTAGSLLYMGSFLYAHYECHNCNPLRALSTIFGYPFRLLDKLLDLRNCDKMGGNELEVLEHYNRKIKKYGEHKEAGEILLKCLYKLDQVRVNISLLQVCSFFKS